MSRTSFLTKAALAAMLLAAGACNLPSRRSSDTSDLPPTPNIIYITATPPETVPTMTLLPLGPLVGTPITLPTAQPTLDLSGVTAVVPANPVATATATASSISPPEGPTVTATPLPPTPTPLPEEGPLYSPRLGINFISSAQHETNAARFQAGINTGAGWDRFAIYWSEIEATADSYSWGAYDLAVHNDLIYGLRTNAILLGTPAIFADSRGIPVNLYEPVFADGSDTPGRGKTINPNNPWAEFVYAAVMRYKPGGELARIKGWGSGQGVRVWEIWNEPDFNLFWQGTVEEYARLLKVAYLAARQADANARIMVGGLVLFEKPGFLGSLLNIFKNEGFYPFDIVAVHSYSHPPYTFHAVQTVENLLALYGLGDTPVWLNESGVAVWDDYPGPTWAVRGDQIIWRASQQEQAAYVIQSAAYAFMAGAEVVFHFQLYDDCGNQPRGTTFPPHDGSLCNSGAVCWGDALGLMRNGRDNACFNQHPNPNTPRPAYEAFHTVGQVFAGENFVPLTAFSVGPERRLLFARPDSAEIITVVWNESGQPVESVLPARSGQAILISQGGAVSTIQPGEDNAYHITLGPATNKNQVGLPASVGYMIGGAPVILIEQTPRPIVTVLPLLDYSNTALLVKWRSSDPSIRHFEVWYRDDTSRGDWQLWLETDTQGEAFFMAGSGRRYSFFARGRLANGTWTSEVPVVQAWTIIQ